MSLPHLHWPHFSTDWSKDWGLHWPAVLHHTGLAALAVVVVGVAIDSSTVVIAGVLALILATWCSIVTGNRSF